MNNYCLVKHFLNLMPLDELLFIIEHDHLDLAVLWKYNDHSNHLWIPLSFLPFLFPFSSLPTVQAWYLFSPYLIFVEQEQLIQKCSKIDSWECSYYYNLHISYDAYIYLSEVFLEIWKYWGDVVYSIQP
jgi:hypothetical protein